MRFHRLDEAVPTRRKPELRAKRQWQGGPNTVSAVGLTPGVRNARQAATALSALQLEAVLYACQRHETKEEGKRGGFFIGDGAGMGKGREIAGCLIENLLQGREKALWVSISADLKVDAERDLSGTKF